MQNKYLVLKPTIQYCITIKAIPSSYTNTEPTFLATTTSYTTYSIIVLQYFSLSSSIIRCLRSSCENDIFIRHCLITVSRQLKILELDKGETIPDKF